MHKKTILLVSLLALTLLSIPALAAKTANKPAATNGLNKGANDHLYLFEKDEGSWEIIEDGAWAKMNINLKQWKFVFNGHGVDPGDYKLICYVDPWPGEGSKVLGNGTADENGNIHIKGPINYTELHDINPEDYNGSKIWLVPAADFDETQQKMVAWNATQILFEFDLLNTRPVEES